MKKNVLLTTLVVYVSVVTLSYAGDTSANIKNEIKHAPIEWLIVQTLISKQANQAHALDPLVLDIYDAITYLPETDDIILQSNKELFNLEKSLISYLENLDYGTEVIVAAEDDKKLTNLAEVIIEKKETLPEGHYFFNHVHTNISQDNAGLKRFKISAELTFKITQTFLNDRNSLGTLSFNDHDTDSAYDITKEFVTERLNLLRGVEWGGRTHMGLIGIKPKWDNLSRGREYEYEESIRQSRSSEGFRVINHPNERETPFPYTSWIDADGVEIWNSIVDNKPINIIGKYKPKNNVAALKQWADALKAGLRYTGMAGSDSHFLIPCLRDRVIFYPANYIPNTDIKNTKSDLFKGNVSFLTTPVAPKLNLRAKFTKQTAWSGMGDDVSGSGEVEFELDADFSDTYTGIRSVCFNVVNRFSSIFRFRKKRIWQIRFFNLDGDLIAKKNINPAYFGPKRSFTAKSSFLVNGANIIRAELWQVNRSGKLIDMLGGTNPVYLNF